MRGPIQGRAPSVGTRPYGWLEPSVERWYPPHSGRRIALGELEGSMWNTDDLGVQADYAAELGDEWTEVEPGIFVRVETSPMLQVVDSPEPPQATKGVA